ncbi:MAG: ATP-binding protein [Halodesulfovibrio sp.]
MPRAQWLWPLGLCLLPAPVQGAADMAEAGFLDWFGGTLVMTALMVLVPAVAMLLWHRLVRPRMEEVRRNAVVIEACRMLPPQAGSDDAVLRPSLVRYAMEATGAPLAYLVLFVPEPVIVCHADESGIVLGAHGTGWGAERERNRQAEGASNTSGAGGVGEVAFESREFWSGLMEGEAYAIAETGSEWTRCAYPLEQDGITRHLAVAMMSGRAPVAVLGVANSLSRFTERDAGRLKTMLVAAWECVLLRNQLAEKEREFALHRSILQTAPMGLAILNFHGDLLTVNPAFHTLYRLNDHYRVTSVFSLVRPDRRHVLEDAITQVMHVGGAPLELEMEHLRDDSEFVAGVSLVRLGGPGAIRLLMTVTDVSGSREARRQLEGHRDKLERMVLDRTVELQNALVFAESTRDRIDMILRSIADGLLVTDMHNRITLMNSNAELFLGVALQDAVGMQVGQALGQMPFRMLVEEHVARTRNGAVQQFEFAAAPPGGGQERYIRAIASQVLDKHDLPAGVVTIMHDVSRERELDVMKSEFLSMAAHELRTPLTTIQGFSDLLRNRKDLSEEERSRFLDMVNQNAQTLSGIVSDLLDISRIESGRSFTMYYETFDLAELTGKHVELWRSGRIGGMLSSVDHAIAYEGPDSGVLVHGDRTKCQQILENLIGNAVKYSPKGGAITVRLEADAAVVQASVEDHGMGMSREQRERAFEKFFRANTDGGIQGTGLGLPIVKHYVEAHGGEVWLESEPDKGTRVSFTLPTAEVTKARLYTAAG